MKKIEIISKWIDSQGLRRSNFEAKAKLSNGYVGNMLKSKSEVSDDKLADILKAYPELENVLENGVASLRVFPDTHPDNKGALSRILRFFREFDAPLARWIENKVDGDGLSKEDELLLQDKFEQIQRNKELEYARMKEDIKMLPLNKKKKDNSQ